MPHKDRVAKRHNILPQRIFGKISSNFIQKSQQSCTEIKLIDPADYKQYFDWGEVGERIMERALNLL